MTIVAAFLGATVLLTLPAAALPQAYPAKPVRLVMGPPAGGPTDGVGRVIAMKLSDLWGQQMVIENRPGAGNTIATAIVAKAAPDGYTLLLCPISDAVAPALHRKLPYDFMRDFAAIAHIGTTPNVFVVHPSVPAKSVREFVAYAKANPGKLDYAATGIGQSGHLSFELLKTMTGINVVYIPYKTVGVAVTDLLSGRVSAQITNLPAQVENIRIGKVRALGVTSAKRSARVPEVPTIAESGVPGFEVTVWYGLCAPAAVPRPLLDKVGADLLKVVAMPDVRQRLADQGVDVEPMTAEQFASFIKAETVKWAGVVKKAGITPQ
jgi:tripartite-type tricarboxylate transporter receptor subunit TctC